jgi:hypothetical protein
MSTVNPFVEQLVPRQVFTTTTSTTTSKWSFIKPAPGWRSKGNANPLERVLFKLFHINYKGYETDTTPPTNIEPTWIQSPSINISWMQLPALDELNQTTDLFYRKAVKVAHLLKDHLENTSGTILVQKPEPTIFTKINEHLLNNK